MGILRKLAVGAAAAVVVLVGMPAAASAEELPISGSFVGTGGLFGPPCSFIPVHQDGTGDFTSIGAITFSFEFCTENGTPNPISAGTMTVTTAEGTLTGDLTGVVEAGGPGPEFPLHFVWTVTGGTGRFEGATGQVAMEGAFGLGAFNVHGTVDGTITIPPTTPATKADCMNGGWRDVTDENGDPFRNQGECIAWVIHNT